MAEEANEKKACACAKPGIKVIIGVVLIAVGLSAVVSWWLNLMILLKGCVGLLLIMAGAISIAIAKE